MRLRRSSKFVGLSLGALLLTLGLIFIAKTRWEHQQLMQALDPYVKGLVSFKLSRSDNQHQYYIEDLVQIQVSQEATELVIVRHIPRNDQLHLRIEKAELQPNKTVMLLTHRSGNLCRIYLQPTSFLLSVINRLKNVVAMETGVTISADQLKLFQQDPLYEDVE